MENPTSPNLYIIVSHEFVTNEITPLYVTNCYDSALLEVKNRYKQYTDNDDYIVREITKNNIMVYKRNYGYIWNTKDKLLVFKILSYKL